MWVLLVLAAGAGVLPVDAVAERAPQRPAAATLDVGNYHSCALVSDGGVRCWGFGGDGQLGYGNTNTIGDNETPGSVEPVNVGAGRTVTAISAGDYHTCALLDDGNVRCWGFGGDGRLGYGNTKNIGDDETPGSVGPVDLGPGRTATAISASGGHTCAVLDDGSVRCWGYGFNGELGYASQASVGDDEAPDAAGPVKLGRRAVAISAGGRHTCALLDDGSVRCWGNGGSGRLGYGSEGNLGDKQAPDTAGPVKLGRRAVAISAGAAHTCAVLDDGNVRCWGFGANGRLGYGDTNNIGDNETPDSGGPVNLGPGRSALTISAGSAHTCALLNDGAVRCWGYGGNGRLGYASTNTLGDDKTPDSAGPVNLGPGRAALATSAGQSHTCARLDDGNVRCWGAGANGRLGYCGRVDIGDDETPGSVGTVNLEPKDGGVGCQRPPIPGAGTTPSNGGPKAISAVGSDTARGRALRGCLAGVTSRANRMQKLARTARQRASTRRQAARGRGRCLRRYARSPGRVIGLRARARGSTRIELDFKASGTDNARPPPAHSYVIKQSRRPIRSASDFARAQTLCNGKCRFRVSQVGGGVSLKVTHLRPHTTYYYAVAARDNVSAHRGPRSQAVKGGTR